MSKNQDKVAFIVVCWNNKGIIGGCIDSILAQDYLETAIYVIDNNSEDGSADFIEQKYPKVNLVRSKENTGFSKGNNILVERALKDEEIGYIALINSDATIAPNWTSEIVNYISKKTRVAAAQGITLDYYDHDTIDAEHVYVGNNFQSVQYGYGEKVGRGFLYPRKVFGVNAAAAVYTRPFIEDQYQKRLFDEKFYMYLEDVDVCFRAIVTGWNNYAVPSAEAYHMGSVSMKKRSGSYNIRMTFRNQSALLYKNLSFKVFIKFLPEAINFERHFYRHLKKTRGVEVRNQALKGRAEGILRIPLYFNDRRRLKSKRAISDSQLLSVMKSRGIY